jgi:hypothetical protein
MDKYTQLCDVFKDKKCELLTTREEYDRSNKHRLKVVYKASCGHTNTIHIGSFKHRGSGVLCKPCIYANYKVSCRKKRDSNQQEAEGLEYIKTLLTERFIVEKVVDGSLADCIIKPKEVDEDKWLPVQLKVSTNAIKYNFSSFHIQRDYPNTIIICIHLNDKHIWVFDGNMKFPKKLNLSLDKGSKYSENYTKESELANRIDLLYKTYHLTSIIAINKPTAIYQQRELEYRRRRENNLPLVFEYPTIENRVYDFICNGKKCQEKVAGKHGHSDTYMVQLCKRNGTLNKKRLYQQYVKGDNDIYWFHIPDTDMFYVIPENELYVRGLIADFAGCPKVSMPLRPHNLSYKYGWSNTYLFSYSKLDIEKLNKLL